VGSLYDPNLENTMLLAFATLAMLAFCISIGAVGGALLWRGRLGWRALGAVLLVQGLLTTAALIALSTVPFGIGEPLIRVPFVEIMLQALGSAAAIGGVTGLVYLVARAASARLPQGRGGRRLAAAGLLIAVPLVAAGSMAGLVRASTPERERERDPKIVSPDAFLSGGYQEGIMYRGYAQALTAQQINDLIAYMLTLKSGQGN
jgi:hypothetical protein